MKNNITALLFIGCIFLSCNNPASYGADGPDVIPFKDAYAKLSRAETIWFLYCTSRSSNPKQYSGDAIGNGGFANCTVKKQDGYLWKRSVNYCEIVILSTPCPTNGKEFTIALSLAMSRCDLSGVRVFNLKKPLQGHWFSNSVGTQVGCL